MQWEVKEKPQKPLPKDREQRVVEKFIWWPTVLYFEDQYDYEIGK